MANSKKNKGFRKYKAQKQAFRFPWKAALIVACVIIALIVGYIVLKNTILSDGSLPAKNGRVSVGDATWLVGDLADDGESARFYKLAELDGIEGYILDDDDDNSNLPRGSFTFRSEAEADPVNTLYVSYAPDGIDVMVDYFAEKMGAIYPVFEMEDLGLTTFNGVDAHIASYFSGLTYEDNEKDPIYTRTALAYLTAPRGASVVIFAFSDSFDTPEAVPEAEPLMAAVEAAANSLRIEPDQE